jgi:hypothetical protein
MKSEITTSRNGQSAILQEASFPLSLWKQPLHRKNQAVGSPSLSQQMPGVHHIELNLRDINQLFNTMDPSPFHEKDLDHDAEEFILSWAQEFHRHEPVDLIVHLEKLPEGQEAKRLVGEAVRNYFAYRARLNELEFTRLMKQGRMSLLVGLSFLGLCLLIIELLLMNRPGALPSFLTQSLTIAGWVAMWRPMEIYLYSWWPLRRRGQIFDKLSRMQVEVRKRT